MTTVDEAVKRLSHLDGYDDRAEIKADIALVLAALKKRTVALEEIVARRKGLDGNRGYIDPYPDVAINFALSDG